MVEEPGLPRRHSNFITRTIHPPAGFLPLSESIYSPRGSVLNSIILSHTSGRTRSVHDGEFLDGGTTPSLHHTTSLEAGTATHNHHVPGAMASESMRGLRLIGNSNPRYKWLGSLQRIYIDQILTDIKGSNTTNLAMSCNDLESHCERIESFRNLQLTRIADVVTMRGTISS